MRIAEERMQSQMDGKIQDAHMTEICKDKKLKENYPGK